MSTRLSYLLVAGIAMLVGLHPAIGDRVWAYGVLSALVGLCFCARQPGAFGFSKVYLGFLGLLGLSVVSAFFQDQSALISALFFVSQLLFFVAGYVLAADRAAVGRVAWAVAMGGGGMGLYGLLQFYQMDPMPAAALFRQLGRVVGSFENPNDFGNYLALCLPIGVAMYVGAVSRKGIFGGLGLCGLCYAGLLLSGSRGAWVAGMVGVSVCLLGLGLQRYRSGRFGYRVAGLALSWILLTVYFADSPVLQTPSGPVAVARRLDSIRHVVADEALHDVGMAHRFWIWRTTWEMIRQVPFWGYGYGAFPAVFWAMAEGETDFEPVQYAHNEGLHRWVEGGLPGVVGWFGLIAAVVAHALQCARHAGKVRLDIWAGLGLVSAMLAHSMVSYPLHLPLNGMVFYLALGVVGRAR